MSGDPPTQTCMELAVELTRGPELFNARGEPTEFLERYTGSRVTQDLERCLIAGALRSLECSDRKIAAALNCDVRSIPLMIEAAERSGRIPALKERLAKLTGRNAERAQIALGELLGLVADGKRDLELAATIKAVATAGGIATQNLQLLTGGPTEILELRVGAGRAEIEEWAKQVAVPVEATVTTAPIDSASAGTTGKPMQNGDIAVPGHAQDTSTSHGNGQAPGVAGPPGEPGTAGGGSAGAGCGPESNGSNGS